MEVLILVKKVIRQLSPKKEKSICDNFINGNTKDWQKQVDGLNKLQLIELLKATELYGVDSEELCRKIILHYL